MRRRPGRRSDVLAMTELDEELKMRSVEAYYPAVLEAARRHNLPSGAVLGAAIGHEVGHLILGATAHSHRGLMSSNWSRPEFELLSIGELSFTHLEAKPLRNEILTHITKRARCPMENSQT